MTLFETLVNLEENDDVHLGRLLVLMSAFSKNNGETTIDGLTKLAKLDFLLRYPALLERALHAKGFDSSKAEVQTHERESVESRMVRYRYGPWDFRYRRFLNLLVARGLCALSVEGRTITITLTEFGLDTANKLVESGKYNDLASRSALLKKYFNKSGTWLKDFVYETFPEVTSLRLGEEIS